MNALPQSDERKKWAKEGVGRMVTVLDYRKEKVRHVLVQVKSGHVGDKDIQKVRAVTVGHSYSLFIAPYHSTKPLRPEHVTAGFHH